ncbi:tetratricopeptide repeat protein [Streptomyces sp. NPDC057236]|uniref:tetratricopeptide repeat protein n=1 Tax=Streptomyces sp. NPDC057236 TaxID=3346059 RepID=UPI0036403F82
MRDSHGSLDAFAGGDDITTDVRAVFPWSYKALSAPAARLFRLLGLHCGPDVSVPAVAALAGLPPRGTRGLLGEPTRAHLLTEHFPGRCTLHDWSQGTTLSHLGDSYQRLGRFDEAAGCLEEALAVLRAHDNRWAEGITLDILGTVHRRLHRHDEAVEHYHRALRTHRDIGNRWGEGRAPGNLGDAQLGAGKSEAARGSRPEAPAILSERDHADAEKVRERLARLGRVRTVRHTSPSIGTRPRHRGKAAAGHPYNGRRAREVQLPGRGVARPSGAASATPVFSDWRRCGRIFPVGVNQCVPGLVGSFGFRRARRTPQRAVRSLRFR